MTAQPQTEAAHLVAGVRRLRSNAEAFDRYQAVANLPRIVAQVVYIPVVAIPLVVSTGPVVTDAFDAVDVVFWALFTLDYLARLYLVATPRRYFVRHLLDLALILLWMLPIFAVPKGVPLLRAILGLRLAPLALSALQHLVETVRRPTPTGDGG